MFELPALAIPSVFLFILVMFCHKSLCPPEGALTLMGEGIICKRTCLFSFSDVIASDPVLYRNPLSLQRPNLRLNIESYQEPCPVLSAGPSLEAPYAIIVDMLAQGYISLESSRLPNEKIKRLRHLPSSRAGSSQAVPTQEGFRGPASCSVFRIAHIG